MKLLSYVKKMPNKLMPLKRQKENSKFVYYYLLENKPSTKTISRQILNKMENYRKAIKKDIAGIQNNISEIRQDRAKSTNTLEDIIKDLKDKTCRIVKLETLMFESSNFIKMAEKHRRSIEKLLKKNMIGYQDSMSRMDYLIKNVTEELEKIKKEHNVDFTNLANDINKAKEPLKHVLDRATLENDMVLKELERTQK